jgi:uncharacterized membrane protein YhhN
MNAPLALMAAGLVALLAAEFLQNRAGIWLAKTGASAGFVWLALVHHVPTWAIVAVVLSMVGDILLIPKNKKAFLAGLGAFLIAHLAFAIAFAKQGIVGFSALIAILLMLLISRQVSKWLMPHVKPAMRMPVSAYMMAISLMVGFAYGAWRGGMHWAVLVGAVAFAASGIAVARNRFVAPGFHNKTWGLPLYFGAQAILVLSFAQA